MGIVGHGVDGEIPAGQVFPEAFFKVHPVRTPVIPVSPLRCEGGDLNGLPAGHNGDGAVLLSGADQGKVLKHLGNLPGRASVHKSQSWGASPSSQSRTQPPTAQASKPRSSSRSIKSRTGTGIESSKKHTPLQQALLFPQSWHKTGEKSRYPWKLCWAIWHI